MQYETSLSHSFKGTKWKNHKYIKKINGVYYYGDTATLQTIKNKQKIADKYKSDSYKLKSEARSAENESEKYSEKASRGTKLLNSSFYKRKDGTYNKQGKKVKEERDSYSAKSTKYKKIASSKYVEAGEKYITSSKINTSLKKYTVKSQVKSYINKLIKKLKK